MKSVSVVGIILLSFTLFNPANLMAADAARDPAVILDVAPTPRSDQLREPPAPVLVVSLDEETFTDLGPAYEDAFMDEGYDVDLVYNPTGGDIYSGRYLVLVSTTDNWWVAGSYDSQTPLWEAFIDDGGLFVLVGQDYLYGVPDLGFATDYLGVADVAHDANFGDCGDLEWYGTAGGPLAGLGDIMGPCFSSNCWYTDVVTPAEQGLCMWSSPDAPGPWEGGSARQRTIFSSVEFACGDGLWDAVPAFLDWFAFDASSIVVRPDGLGDVPTIRAAIELVEEGGTVYLTDGVFTGPDNINLGFGGKNLTLRSLSLDPDACAIDGETPPVLGLPRGGEFSGIGSGHRRPPAEGRDLDDYALLFMFGESQDSRVEGITFRNFTASNFYGGAVIIVESSPVFENCRFEYCGSDYGGAAVWVEPPSTAQFVDCEFAYNYSMWGGGIGMMGPGSDLLIEDCVFHDNMAYGGAGIFFQQCEPVIESCTFYRNEAYGGAGICSFDDCTGAFVRYCTFCENSADFGPGLYSESAFLFWYNVVAYNAAGGSVEITVPPNIACCDFFGNTEGDWYGSHEGLMGTDGNFCEDPQFCGSLGTWDYRLQSDSPCAPDNNPCLVQLGAWPVLCGSAATGVSSWSALKKMY